MQARVGPDGADPLLQRDEGGRRYLIDPTLAEGLMRAFALDCARADLLGGEPADHAT